jgi:hypothetical protein
MNNEANSKINCSQDITEIVDKIRKLLSLANSPNENEAGAAASKAAELLQKHNLEIDDIGEEIEIVEEVILEDESTAGWKGLLFTGISQLNGLHSFRRRRKGSKRAKCIMVGRPLSILVGKQTYLYLRDTVERLALEHKGEGKSFINSFKLGLASRLKQRLAEKRQEINEDYFDSNGALVAKNSIRKRYASY